MARFAPAAVVAPRGLAGTFEDYQPGAILDTSRLRPNVVLLNVYDVGDNETVNSVNKFFTGNGNVLVAGIFHGGVEVYGQEWSYGACEDDRTGVTPVPPRMHPQHSYKNTTIMGETSLSRAQVAAVVNRMQKEWPGNAYSLIHNNCINFCNAVLAELGLRRVPGWVDRAARAASNLDHTVQTLKSISAEDVQEQVLQVGGQAACVAGQAACLAGGAFDVVKTGLFDVLGQALEAAQQDTAKPQPQQRHTRPAQQRHTRPAPSADGLMQFMETAAVQEEEAAKPARTRAAAAPTPSGAAPTHRATAAAAPPPAPMDLLDLLGDGPPAPAAPPGAAKAATSGKAAPMAANLIDLLGDDDWLSAPPSQQQTPSAARVDLLGAGAAGRAGVDLTEKRPHAPAATTSALHAPAVGFDLLA